MHHRLPRKKLCREKSSNKIQVNRKHYVAHCAIVNKYKYKNNYKLQSGIIINDQKTPFINKKIISLSAFLFRYSLFKDLGDIGFEKHS